ncbi:MAG: hypothetical protein JXB35_12690 [Anaerolineae bacterium]|nr:hypothetical protein [Anaerolineae bacterium]
MRRLKRLFVILGIILVAGCSRSTLPFTDDFSDPGSGWMSASTETFVRGYDVGKYLIRIDVPQWFAWTTSGQTFKDTRAEVVVRSEGAADNHYGLLCRYSEAGYYYFAISADGYYGIFRKVGDTALELLTGSAMVRSSLIHKDNLENRLAAVCDESILALYVNGEQVARVEDDTLTQGDIGLAAGTGRRGGTTLIWFDDLIVDKP